ncbi:unnamed protein product [Protopolystoma xenopodis]|uniref:Uncharacterized protein n=1 Tax=Protopolystoma xenopodis TaxID=117903 RepID=A0A448WUQ1_9PLAT|nr:unnamed protein product [Protopolystoma xenopodis]
MAKFGRIRKMGNRFTFPKCQRTTAVICLLSAVAGTSTFCRSGSGWRSDGRTGWLNHWVARPANLAQNDIGYMTGRKLHCLK